MSAPLCVRCTSHDRRACEGVRQFATITASCSCGCHFAPQVGGAVVPVSDAEADRDAQRTRAEAAEAEVARLRSLIDVTARDLVAAKASAEGWREEATGLRAIVEGRTTAPTMAEWAAHDGEWDVLIDFAATPWCRAHRSRATISGPAGPALIQEGTPVRWWPVDDERRLCPWPVLA